MTSPVPDRKVFVLTCTRGEGSPPERFRVAARDAEHAVQIAKRQGLAVVEFHVESPLAVQGDDQVYAVEPAVPAMPRPKAVRPAVIATSAGVKAGATEAAPARGRRKVWIAVAAGGVALVMFVVGGVVLYLLRPHGGNQTPKSNQPSALAPGVAPSGGDDWYAPLFAAASPSCVTVQSRRGNGSGFAVKPYLICTNAHVVNADARRTLKIVQPESGLTANVVGVIHFDAYHDIALLAVDRPFPALPLAPVGPPPPGEALLAIGSPGVNEQLTLQNSLSRLLAAKPVPMMRTTMLQLNGSVNPGNSGGPVLNRRNQVVGMVTAKARDKDGIGFAVLAQDIREAVEGSERTTPEMKTAADKRHAAVALVHRVVFARAYEFYLLKEWDSVVDTIPSKSQYVGHALSSSREQLDKQPKVQAFRDRMRDDAIGPDIDLLAQDGVSPETIKAIREFDRAVQEMSMFATYPRGTPQELRQKIKLHTAAIEATTKRACELLDLPEPDWEEETE